MTAQPATTEMQGNPLVRFYHRLSLKQRRTIIGYVFIMPFILGFIFWFLIPALVAGYLTFHNWNLISPPRFVGLDNIERLFTDPILPKSLQASFVYTLFSSANL